MRITNDWKDFEVLDAGNEMKVERYASTIVKRPEPTATWNLSTKHIDIDASFDKAWNIHTKDLNTQIAYKDLKFLIRGTAFKHTGLFPEQAVNWDWMRSVIQKSPHDNLRILNLFGYTGGATIACAKEKKVAEVVHIDALKSLNEWTQENVGLNQLKDKTIRTITEDVMKFLAREKRRGRTYHGIIMDPPSFGRGPKGQRWDIVKQLEPLLRLALEILDKDAIFLVLNTYSTNLSAQSVNTTFSKVLKEFNFPRNIDTQAIGLPITYQDKILRCGQTTRWSFDENLL
ncbi:SAM-dependent methyltransferase [Erysipelothrix sp. HDW6A]|uniref:class I SAM-dependent methyltransferase n=1 Tax=Erysipelothrix sp. HDW6A TaxID=2714928 RepID=UPI001409F84B|nr:class I SAM-dependent methyltransferase [Erysipelothrix sp. HDW6A]QIK57117.1 SAM-dependent methyltransferase [Erysipelothrix sp. HDW6A]